MTKLELKRSISDLTLALRRVGSTYRDIGLERGRRPYRVIVRMRPLEVEQSERFLTRLTENMRVQEVDKRKSDELRARKECVLEVGVFNSWAGAAAAQTLDIVRETLHDIRLAGCVDHITVTADSVDLI